MAPSGVHTPAPISAGADVTTFNGGFGDVMLRSSSSKQMLNRVSPLLPVLTGGRHATPDRMPSEGQRRECQHKLNCRRACSIPGKASKAGELSRHLS